MKNKYIRNTLITVVLYLFMILYVYFINDSVFAKASSDYVNQHTMFIDYIRRNFWASGDFFPQLSMNYGLGQSFVIMFYYGMFNPFVMLSYILPPINPVFVFEIIFMLVISLNSLAMTKLLSLNKIDGRFNTAISVLSSFSGIFIFHMSTHPMFIYYLPIMVLSLVALHYLVDRGIKSFYMLTVGMIFFTNFTFAPMISILQFFYFIGLLVEQNKFNIKQVTRFFKTYIVGVMIGMMILIPTALFMLQASSRGEELAMNIGIFNSPEFMIEAVSSYAYVSGIYIIGIFALIGGLTIIRNRKYYIILLPMLLVLFFAPLNFALNLFEYIHPKVYIMYLPLYWLMFAEIIKRGNKIQLALLTIVSTLIFYFGHPTLPFDMTIVSVILLSAVIYILVISRNKLIISSIVVLLVYLSVSNQMITTPREDLDLFVNANGEIPAEIGMYRELTKKNNTLENIYSMVPNVYSSLENGYYIQGTRLEFESAISSFVRQTKYYPFDNIYYENLFALANDDFETNPIIYGVDSSDVYNISEYSSLDKNEKLFAANQAIFTEDATNTGYSNSFSIEEVYSSDEPITIDKEVKEQFAIPEEYQNGVLNISFSADLAHDDSQFHKIMANDQVNYVMYQDRYGVNDNSEVTFRINTTGEDTIKLKVSPQTDVPITYSNFKVSYQSLDDFVDNKINVVTPENYSVDMNNSFEFDLDMENDGYVATTLPFDNGFDIYIDDEKVEVEKIDDLYIGAQISSGNHHVVIEYHIPGFKIGLILTVLALIFAAITFIFDVKKLLNKNL